MVTVTAQGRKQEVQKVPIAIQLVGPEEIAKVGAVNLSQVADFVPGLSVDASQPTQPSYALRGLGNGDFGIGTDAPVGVYVNGIYTGKTGGALLNFNDVKRVEVLKGPQGTLFGRNSAGGAISIVTNDPDGQRTGLGPRARRQLRHGACRGRRQPAAGRGPEPAHLGGRREERRLGHQHRRRQEEPAVQDLGHAPGRALVAHRGHQRRARLGARGPERAPAPDLGGAAPTAPAASSSWIDPRHAPLANDVVGGARSRACSTARTCASSTTSATRSCSRRPPAGAISIRSTSRTTTAPPTRPRTWPPATSRRARRSSRSSASTARARLADWLVGASFATEHSAQTSSVGTNTTTLDPLLFQILNAKAGGLPAPPFALLTGIGQLAGIPGFDLLGQPWKESMHNTLAAHSEALMADVIWHVGDKTNVTTGVRFTQDPKKFSWYNPLRSAPGLDAQLAVLSPDFFQQLVDAGALDPATAGALGGPGAGPAADQHRVHEPRVGRGADVHQQDLAQHQPAPGASTTS